MGKFVARTFIPGELPDEAEAYAFDFAWLAWESFLLDRQEAEAKATGADPADYIPALYSVWGDLNELAQPDSYDDARIFGVASVGHEWLGSYGTGTLWGRSPGVPRADHDKGICYQVTWQETGYVGL